MVDRIWNEQSEKVTRRQMLLVFENKTASTAIDISLKTDSALPTFSLASVGKVMNKSGRFSDHWVGKELDAILEKKWLNRLIYSFSQLL